MAKKTSKEVGAVVAQTEEESINLIRIEHYIDADPENPKAFTAFSQRIRAIDQELDYWQTLVIDSVTYMEIAARYESQFKLNKTAKDGRQHFGYSTDRLEQILMVRFGTLDCNVVVLCHIDEDKDEQHGFMVRNPSAPGRMRKRFSSGYSEFYRAYRGMQDTELYYAVQTAQDLLWNASTQIGAPNPCYPDFAEVWVNWEGPRIPLHTLVYGDSGGGKSTFATTFPTPMLVFAFDPRGKEIPYLKKGHLVTEKEENGIFIQEVIVK